MTGKGRAIGLVALAALALPSGSARASAPSTATDNREELVALVEIPAGGSVKYELDPRSGRLVVDRFLQMPMAYPANYGSAPGSLAADGDPLDILIFTREPVLAGALIRVRPLGLLRMTDGGKADDKIIAIPVDSVDAGFSAIRSVADLPEMDRKRLIAFFEAYKLLPAGQPAVKILGIEGVDAARQAIAKAFIPAGAAGHR